MPNRQFVMPMPAHLSGGISDVPRPKVIAFTNQKGRCREDEPPPSTWPPAFVERRAPGPLCIDLDPQGQPDHEPGDRPRTRWTCRCTTCSWHDNVDPRGDPQARGGRGPARRSTSPAAEIAMSTKIGRVALAGRRALRPNQGGTTTSSASTRRPASGLLTINALTASDKVIVPVQCEYLSMRGLGAATEHAVHDPRRT